MFSNALKIRSVAAAAAIAAAALVAPASVANATPVAPLPSASTLADVDDLCADPAAPCVVAAAEGPTQNSLFWFGPANPDFQPLFGITFPNVFGLDFEACFLGGAVHLSPYGSGFVGIGRGC